MNREFLIALLDDPHGINEAAWTLLSNFIREHPEGDTEHGYVDILNAVDSCEGRYFLPENFLAVE